jgi:type 1 fimbriae regulatory protein FimB/type 1 fimbriae regulatory protein FimE
MSNVIALAASRTAAPMLENRKVSRQPVARRPKNADVRSREFLEQHEVAALTKAAKAGRYGQRDATLIMVTERHGLRVSEAIALRWDAVDLNAGTIAITRLNKGTPSTHYLKGPAMRALRDLCREWPDSPFLFTSERGGPDDGRQRAQAREQGRPGSEATLPPSIRICSGTRPGFGWPMRRRTPAPSKAFSVTATSRTR